jgi:hypothetical protein
MTKKTLKSTKPASQKGLPSKKNRAVFAVLITLIAAGSIYVLTNWAYAFFYVQPRETRIVEIYDSLDLGDEYRLEDVDISGQKKTYEWDPNRSYSSSAQLIRGLSVDDTFAELDKKITAAGFTKIDEAYPGSLAKQYHYKSEKGEYIRVGVTSKVRDDAIVNFTVINPDASTPEEILAIDPNTGPSNVTIKVNLDDNNE